MEEHGDKAIKIEENKTIVEEINNEKKLDHSWFKFDKKYNLTPDVKVFLFVGRINVLKNVFPAFLLSPININMRCI